MKPNPPVAVFAALVFELALGWIGSGSGSGSLQPELASLR
jgi:hypothetical protein